MAIEFIDTTKGETDPDDVTDERELGPNERDIYDEIKPSIEQLLTALRAAAVGAYHSKPLLDLPQHRKIICLLYSLRNAYQNCYEDAMDEGVILGITADGVYLIPAVDEEE